MWIPQRKDQINVSGGKGQFRDGRKAKLAHRVAWELTRGELAPGQPMSTQLSVTI
jgi:hypothetical protein